MNNSMLTKLVNSWKRINDEQKEESAIDTLSAFVQDTEHEMISVVTALQAHIDLLHDEQKRHHMPVDRFAIIDRAVRRLISDTTILASVSAQVRTPLKTQKLTLETLVSEIIDETKEAFKTSQVSLSCNIARGTTLIGNAGSMKTMIKGVILAVLSKCNQKETLTIVGLTHKKLVSVSVDTSSQNNEGEFKPWELGKLRLIPTNGEGITLAAVEAIARLNNGHLSVRTSADQRHGYRLIFNL